MASCPCMLSLSLLSTLSILIHKVLSTEAGGRHVNGVISRIWESCAGITTGSMIRSSPYWAIRSQLFLCVCVRVCACVCVRALRSQQFPRKIRPIKGLWGQESGDNNSGHWSGTVEHVSSFWFDPAVDSDRLSIDGTTDDRNRESIRVISGVDEGLIGTNMRSDIGR